MGFRIAVLLVAVGVAFVGGHEAHRREWIPLPVRQFLLRLPEGKTPPPGWSFADPAPSPQGAKTDGRIGSLAYLSGYVPASGPSGVTVYDESRTAGGLNLYVSGHAPEAILIDMKGREIHRWHHDFDAEWPDTGACRFFGDEGQRYWRRAHLFEDGRLLAIYDGFGLVELDRDSNVIWARRGGYHHDLQILPDGRIVVLDRDVRPRGRWAADVEDFVAVLDARGRPLERVSILKCFDESRFAPMLDGVLRRGDPFHTNTVQVLDGTEVPGSGVFRGGNVLVSIRELDIVAVLDLRAERVVWALDGLWRRQHQPELLPGPRLLVFDNQGNDGRSRVIEMDPFMQAVTWSWRGTDDAPLESPVLGSCQRLPDGNTLVTESTRGRAVEVTPDGRIVWEFHNPHRAGADGELVANLCEMIRLGPESARWAYEPDSPPSESSFNDQS